VIQPGNKVTPFIWFDNQAEAAANFYVSLFGNSRVVDVARWGEGAPFPKGSAMSATFELDGRQFIAFNGGPHFKFSEVFSMFVSCEDQAEVDRYWNALIADGGAPGRCAWLKDKFGLSWQIVPKALGRLLSDPDAARAGRAMQAMMQMTRIDVVELERAAAGQAS
jgi:predicted 3-demethylubiquinone-9 3-methyltransferase (glyoxalase superfamily)